MVSEALRRNLPVSAMVVVLLVALATVAVAYGLWSETLAISGTVNTGEVDAWWERGACSEFHPWPDGTEPGEVEGKDVGVTTAQVDPDDLHILRITVSNAYPSYAVDCEVHFRVRGTIPIHILGTMLRANSANLTNCIVTASPSGAEKTLSCDQLTVVFIDGIGSQLHPGDPGASSLMIHVEQPAAENSTYEFEAGLCLAQWNESANAAECFAASEP